MQVMCEGRRRLVNIASLIAALVSASMAVHAQEPGNTGEPAPSPSASAPVPALASAAPPPAERVPAVTAVPVPQFTAPPPPAVLDSRFTDAHVDRVVLVPTAETHPAHTVYVSSYDIVGLQAGYALGDRTQLTLSFVPPLTRDPVVPLDLTLKTVLVRMRRVRVAAMVSASGIFGLDEAESAVGRIGGVTELCFDDACRSSVSTAANLSLAGPYLVLADGVGAILRATNLFAVLAELQSVIPISHEGGQINVFAGALGARLSGKVWAVDLAAEVPLDRRSKPAAIPVVVVSVRWL